MSRVILKISGEALKDDLNNVSLDKLKIVVDTIKILKNYNHQIAIVIGGGNFFRGRENKDMNPVTRDTIGMLGTIMNALYIKDYLDKINLDVIISTPFTFPNLIDNYNDIELREKYDNGSIIVFGGGVGKSGYSTDSGVILATEKLDGDFIIKMTNVDGVYDCDPKNNINAKKYDKLTYEEILKKDLKVMDKYAIENMMNNNIKLLVMNFMEYDKLNDYFKGKLVGTEVNNE